MDTATFWHLIEAAKARSKGDQERMTKLLANALKDLGAKETAGFQRELDARMDEAYTWPLWGAAYIMNSGCSDDGFEYFRALLIANGREAFETAVNDPDSLAGIRLKFGEEEMWEFESFLYVPAAVYEELTDGTGLARNRKRRRRRPSGTRWSDDDLKRLHPRLWKKFLHLLGTTEHE